MPHFSSGVHGDESVMVAAAVLVTTPPPPTSTSADDDGGGGGVDEDPFSRFSLGRGGGASSPVHQPLRRKASVVNVKDSHFDDDSSLPQKQGGAGGGGASDGIFSSAASSPRRSNNHNNNNNVRKASMMMPGSYDSNDYEHTDRLLEIPKHRGATSATSFLRLLDEGSMESLRTAWGARHVTVEQFLDIVEPVLQASASSFFDEDGRRNQQAWQVEGWISSAQKAASLLSEERRQRHRRKGSQTPAAAAAATGPSSSFYRGPPGGTPPASRLSRLASTKSIRDFLAGATASPASSPASRRRRMSSLSLIAAGPNNNNNNDSAESSRRSTSASILLDDVPMDSTLPILDGSFLPSWLMSPSGTTATPRSIMSPSGALDKHGGHNNPRRHNFHHPRRHDEDEDEDEGSESDLRQYLRHLFAYIDFQRKHKMHWDTFSSFLVDGITGLAFRTEQGAASDAGGGGQGEGKKAGSDDDDSDDDDDTDEEEDKHGSGDDEIVLHYRIVGEVPMCQASITNYAQQPPAATATLQQMQQLQAKHTMLAKKEWVVDMQYLADVDKVLVVQKHSVAYLDPAALPGGRESTYASSNNADGGAAAAAHAPKKKSEPDAAVDTVSSSSSSKHETQHHNPPPPSPGGGGTRSNIIGDPSPSCLPMHVFRTLNRITAGLFLPSPFFATMYFDSERGVASTSVWQYQTAPSRPPDHLLRAPLFTNCTESTMITCSLYTKPGTEAERLGLDTALVNLECVIWVGTRSGQLMTIRLVKDITNASKPVYRMMSPPKVVGEHRDVVTSLLLIPHTSTVCSSSLDGDIRVYDKFYRCRAVLKFHKLGVTCLAYSRDTLTLFSAGHDGIVAAWSDNLWTSPSYLLQDLSRPPLGGIVAVRIIPQTNVVASCDSNGTIRFFDTRDRRVICNVAAVDGQLQAKNIVKREDLRRDQEEGAIYVTASLGTGGTADHKKTVGGYFSAMVFTGALHRQMVLAGSHAYIAIMSEEQKRNPFCTYDLHRTILFARMTPVFGLVTASNAEVTLWSLKDGLPDTRHRHVTNSPITAVNGRADSDVLLLGLENGDIAAVQISSGTVLQQYRCHDQTIASIALHPTKACMASTCKGIDGLLCLWTDEALLGLESLPAVQSNQTLVHPSQVIPLIASPSFLAFDHTGNALAMGFSQRIVFFAQHQLFSRWLEVLSISHGHVAELNAFAWLDLSETPLMMSTPNEESGFLAAASSSSSAAAALPNERFRIAVGDGRGYITIWEMRLNRSVDDMAKSCVHRLIHLGNNVSTADRFFAAKRQKIKNIAKKMRGGGGGGGGGGASDKSNHGGDSAAATAAGGKQAARNNSLIAELGFSNDDQVGSEFKTILHAALSREAFHGDGGGGEANGNGATTKAAASGVHVASDDLDELDIDPEDLEATALLQEHRRRQSQMVGNDLVSTRLRKKYMARQALTEVEKILRGGDGGGGTAQQGRASPQVEMNRELDMIKHEAGLREQRRKEEEDILIGCLGHGDDDADDNNDGDDDDDENDNKKTTENNHQGRHHHYGTSSSTAAAAAASKRNSIADQKRQERRRRLTKVGLFSMAMLQQMELAKQSPTLSSMDPQLAIALERQQHERTQAIKHYHVGVLPAISGEELLAPPILCVAVDALYPFLLYTGDEAGRLIVWYLGTSDPFLSTHSVSHSTMEGGGGSATASWLKEPHPLSRTSPHHDQPVLSIASVATPFHCITTWGSDNCVVLSTWSGVVLARFQQGPIVDRRWRLGPMLSSFNERSFTVQLMWMKLRRFVLEGYFSASSRDKLSCYGAGSDVNGSGSGRGILRGRASSLDDDDEGGHPPSSHHHQHQHHSREGLLPPLGTSSLGYHFATGGGGQQHQRGFSVATTGTTSDSADSTPPALPLVRSSIAPSSSSSYHTPPLPPSQTTPKIVLSPSTVPNNLGSVLFPSIQLPPPPAVVEHSESSRVHEEGCNHIGGTSTLNATSLSLGTERRRRGGGGGAGTPRAPATPSLVFLEPEDDPGGAASSALNSNMLRHLTKRVRVRMPLPIAAVTALGVVRRTDGGAASTSPSRSAGKQQEELYRTMVEAAAHVALTAQVCKRADVQRQLSPPRRGGGGRHEHAAMVTTVHNGDFLQAAEEGSPPPGLDPSLAPQPVSDDQRRVSTIKSLSQEEGDLQPPNGDGDDGKVIVTTGVNELTASQEDDPCICPSLLPPMLRPSPLMVMTALSSLTGGGGGDRNTVKPRLAALSRLATTSLLPKSLSFATGPIALTMTTTIPTKTATSVDPEDGTSLTTQDEKAGGKINNSKKEGDLLQSPTSTSGSLLSSPSHNGFTYFSDRHRTLTPVSGVSVRTQVAANKRVARLTRAMAPPLAVSSNEKKCASTPEPSHHRSGKQGDDEGGNEDDEDPVERAIREAREKRRCVSMMSHVEVNRRRHEQMHTTQIVMRHALAAIDNARSRRALGHTPYFTREESESGFGGGSHHHGNDDDNDTSKRIVFTRKAIMSRLPPTTTPMH